MAHFYIVSFTSFVGLVIALFVASAMGEANSTHTFFIAMGFIAIAAFFMLHGLATPGFLIMEDNEAVKWSGQIAFTAGALLFGAANFPWQPDTKLSIEQKPTQIWIIAIVIYVAYAIVAFFFDRPLAWASQNLPFLRHLVGALTAGILLATVIRIRQTGQTDTNQLNQKITIALILLAEAQIILTFGEPWRFTWWGYHSTLLAAFILAMMGLVIEFESVRDFRPIRYFATTGSVVSVALALLAGELAARWIPNFMGRNIAIGTALAITAVLYIALFIVVYRSDRLLTEHQEALAQEQRWRSELMQLIVHDLKSPLTAMNGGVDMVLNQQIGPLNNFQERLLKSSASSGERMLKLINDLLDVERLEANSLKLELERFDMGQMLRERVTAAELVAGADGPQVLLALPEEMPAFCGDLNLLQRVVDNLLSNAIKFSPPDGQVKLTARLKPEQLYLTVSDTGPGVPFKDRTFIFQKFGQSAGTERRGTGLGLTFCKMVVEAHQGQIYVGDNPGGGALFAIHLPLETS